MCKCNNKKLTLIALFVFVAVLGASQVFANASSEPLRDPTQPLNYRASTKSPSALKLQAIILGGSTPKAIINGKTVTVGDLYNGKKILKIRENEVVYLSGNQTRTLKLRSSIYKK